MSQENSVPTLRSELASEYGRHVISNSKDKGLMGLFFKVLVVPFVAMLVILAGASFAVANYSPELYTQAKDIIFEQVDFEKITGQTDSVSKEYLDSLLVLNSENQQVEGMAPEENQHEETIDNPLVGAPTN